MRNGTTEQPLHGHDVSDLIGLSVVVDGAIEITEPDGEVSVEIPDPEELAAAAAVARCLMPIRLQPSELRALRHIADWTASDIAGMLGEKTAPETISRWESGKQPMGGYVEKVLRLLVCEHLHVQAPGVDYTASAIAHLIILDPSRSDAEFKVPTIHFGRGSMKVDHKRVQVWDIEQPMAA